MSTKERIHAKQFYSRYPFKNESRKHKTILYEGLWGLCPEEYKHLKSEDASHCIIYTDTEGDTHEP